MFTSDVYLWRPSKLIKYQALRIARKFSPKKYFEPKEQWGHISMLGNCFVSYVLF